jgi:hypothetical protein
MAGHLKPNHLLNVNPQQFIQPRIKEVVYILGLIWADGYIAKYINKKTNKKSYRVEVQLVENDMKDLLTIFAQTGKWNMSTNNYQNNDGLHRQIRTTLCTSSKALHTFLLDNDYSIKSIASPTKILQVIPQELHHYFWHGFFDGDGCLWISKNGYSKQLMLCGSFEQDWICGINLLKRLNIKYNHHIVNASCKCSNLRITNKDGIIKFTNYIYQDKSLVGLTRKYERARLINYQI